MAEERRIDRDLARGTDRDIPVASPPDDGGDRGDFTLPGDTMTVSGPESTLGPTPPSHRDKTRTGTIERAAPNRGLNVATGTMFIIALVAMTVALVLFVAGS